jgi:hypothetical protein
MVLVTVWEMVDTVMPVEVTPLLVVVNGQVVTVSSTLWKI